MTREELGSALSAVAERLTTLIVEDAELRGHLRRLIEAILSIPPVAPAAGQTHEGGDDSQATAEPEAGTTDSLAMEQAAMPAAPTSPTELPSVPPRIVPIGPELLAPTVAAEPSQAVPRWPEVSEAELALIESRCRLKAEGARWAAMRRQRLAAGADFRLEIEPRDRDIIDRARKLPDCFLWMCNPGSDPAPEDATLYEELAGCFDAVACGVALVRSLLGETNGQLGSFEQALDLLAEAQSALRASILRIGASTDSDQNKVFYWLRSTASKHQLFIRRHMRVDDPADPGNWHDIMDRIQRMDSAIQEERQRQKRHQQALGRIRFHLGQLARDHGESSHHWSVIVQSVQSLIEDGVPPSNTAIRELLLPVIDEVPEMDLPDGFRLVMREIDRYLATRPGEQPAESAAEPTAEVREAARMLAGKTVILIGGVPRPHAREALIRSFGLKDLDWIQAREHESIDNFEPHVARDEVALVLLAVRWSSHSFGEVKQFCEKYGKPLVRLPGGYNPNQVAAQIISQVSQQLAASR
ncbi:hypothetical protein [Fontivita pretiosa]|uniref:hypothetical protein n=1 Tax=Fontivita pretiosa TaxID=2989684 RepID=UPI003D17E6BE